MTTVLTVTINLILNIIIITGNHISMQLPKFEFSKWLAINIPSVSRFACVLLTRVTPLLVTRKCMLERSDKSTQDLQVCQEFESLIYCTFMELFLEIRYMFISIEYHLNYWQENMFIMFVQNIVNRNSSMKYFNSMFHLPNIPTTYNKLKVS